MNKIKVKNLIRTILIEAESGAARQAKRQGLRYASFGRWADKSGRVVAKSHGDTLIKVDPSREEPVDKKARADDKLQQIRRYQAAGQQGTPEKAKFPAQVPADQTAQQALDQRKMQQKIQDPNISPELKPVDVSKINPDWYNNFNSDLETTYGLKSDDISPRVLDALYKKRLSSEEAAGEYFKIKNDIKKFKNKECQRLASASENINEQPGEHDHKSIKQLEREIGEIELKKQYNRGLGNFAEWSERMFALRKKKGGSTGVRPEPVKRTLVPGFKISQFGENKKVKETIRTILRSLYV